MCTLSFGACLSNSLSNRLVGVYLGSITVLDHYTSASFQTAQDAKRDSSLSK